MAKADPARDRLGERRAAGRRAGVTLVEVLVVIAIIGVLISVLLPSLMGARSAAHSTVSLANLRTVGGVLAQYAAAYKEAYPYAKEGVTYPHGCDGIQISFGHWQTAYQWPAVTQAVAPWREFAASLLSPRAMREFDDDTCGWPTSYAYSNSFIARPELWQPGATADARLLGPTFVHDVSFASSKVVMWDREVPYLPQPPAYTGPDAAVPTPTLFADGHGGLRVPAKAAAAQPNPFMPDAFQGQARLHNTLGGVRGRDY